ncbi:MAG: DJ-1/PfpI family protein [Clostridia bacterium]|nr:DJ-1/PfpI family protein [Clostridia bacterium]MBR2022939.1 DJ-1/PfpI family protein [Clostridia bacterium]
MVLLFLADGFEEIEALTQVDYLRRAGIEITTVGVNGEYATGTRNIVVKADTTLDRIDYTDDVEMVILPGGLGGMNGMKSSEKVCSIVKKAEKDGKFVTAICASPTIFAHLDMVKGKKCVCYPGMENELIEAGGIYTDEPVVKDGTMITARAAGASEEFSFELIRVLKGEDAAEKVRKSICAR